MVQPDSLYLAVRQTVKLNRQAVRSVHGSVLFVCLLFIGTTVYELVRPYPISSVSALLNQEKTTVFGAGAVTERDVPPQSAFAEIVKRPLFREDRRPYIPETPAEPEQPRDTGPDLTTRISLSAIVIDGDERIALITQKQDKKLQQLRQGEKFDGWTVKRIQPDDITMQKGQETRQIALVVTPSKPTAREPRKEPETVPVDFEEQSNTVSAARPFQNTGKTPRRKPAPRQQHPG